MAIKSQFLLGVSLAIVLLICLDTVHARELTQVNNDLHGNLEPEGGPAGLKEKKTYVNVGIYPQRPFGAYGGFQPFGGGRGGLGNGLGFGGNGLGFGGGFGGNGLGFGRGIGGLGNGLGFGLRGLGPGGFNNFNGYFQQGIGVPGF